MGRFLHDNNFTDEEEMLFIHEAMRDDKPKDDKPKDDKPKDDKPSNGKPRAQQSAQSVSDGGGGAIGMLLIVIFTVVLLLTFVLNDPGVISLFNTVGNLLCTAGGIGCLALAIWLNNRGMKTVRYAPLPFAAWLLWMGLPPLLGF